MEQKREMQLEAMRASGLVQSCCASPKLLASCKMSWRSALGKTLHELRIHLDQGAAASQGVREFVLANYAELKKANPSLPILIREATGAEAKLIARFGHGVEKSVSIQNDKPDTIISKLQGLLQGGAR